MRAPLVFLLAVVVFGTVFALGCGGNAKPATPTATPAAPAPTPTAPAATTPPTTTPPPPTPPSGSGGGSSSSGTAQWTSSVTGANGTVSVTANGDVSVQVTGAQPGTSFTSYFCQYPGSDYTLRGQNACFGLNANLITDGSGSGQLTFHFPQSGTWAGAFYFAPGGDLNNLSARISTDVLGSAGTMSSALLPESKINQGRVPSFFFAGSPQEPGSGTVSLSGGKVSVTLKGATPNGTFTVHECFSDAGSACRPLNTTFTTDASGNGSATIAVAGGSGSVFDVYENNHTYGLVTGFTVP